MADDTAKTFEAGQLVLNASRNDTRLLSEQIANTRLELKATINEIKRLQSESKRYKKELETYKEIIGFIKEKVLALEYLLQHQVEIVAANAHRVAPLKRSERLLTDLCSRMTLGQLWLLKCSSVANTASMEFRRMALVEEHEITEFIASGVDLGIIEMVDHLDMGRNVSTVLDDLLKAGPESYENDVVDYRTSTLGKQVLLKYS